MLRHVRDSVLPAVALAVASIFAAPVAEAGSAAADDAASVQADFQKLYESLQSSGGLLPEDRPVVEAFAQRVDTLLEGDEAAPSTIAIRLQLSRWLKENERTRELFVQLMDATPENNDLAASWIAFERSSRIGRPEELAGVYQSVLERFPDNAAALAAYGTWLRDEARYPELLELLKDRELDPTEDAELLYLRAQALFCEHRFAEALSVFETVPPAALPVRARRERDRDDEFFKAATERWTAELALRAVEEAKDDLPRVSIETSEGTILVELFEDTAPNTVANFISLCSTGFYDDTMFHRFEPNFMIQGGDPSTREGSDTGAPGADGPGYFIADEHGGDAGRRHFSDSLAMAKRPSADSAGSQFYLNHRPTPWLDGKHTVFGRVLEGQDAARRLRKGAKILSTEVVRKRDHEYTPETIPLPDATPAPSATPTPAAPPSTP